MILRGAADQIGERRSRVPDQGGLRKVIALANTIEHLLNNQKTFHAAMHVRIAQSESMKQEGRNSKGTQTKTSLIMTGRRISALKFIVFSVAVGDHLQKRIVPLASKAQKAGVGSWEMDKDCHRVLAEIRHDRCVLRELRRWCFVTCLLQSYLNMSDLRKLWVVLTLSQFGHSFRRLSGNMLKFLFEQTFRGVQLRVDLPGVSAGNPHITLSPRCQCASMITLSPRCQCASMCMISFCQHWRTPCGPQARSLILLRKRCPDCVGPMACSSNTENSCGECDVRRSLGGYPRVGFIWRR